MEKTNLKTLASKVLQGQRKAVTDSPMDDFSKRMEIVGESCAPEEVKPYVTDYGSLVIPFSSDKKYHYWAGGQSLCDTLRELDRCDLFGRYRSIYN